MQRQHEHRWPKAESGSRSRAQAAMHASVTGYRHRSIGQSNDGEMMAESWVSAGIGGDDRGQGPRGGSSRRDGRGRLGTIGDAAGKAVNRKVVGSSPSSGAKFEFKPDSSGISGPDTMVVD